MQPPFARSRNLRVQFTLDPERRPTRWAYIQDCRCGMEVFADVSYSPNSPDKEPYLLGQVFRRHDSCAANRIGAQ